MELFICVARLFILFVKICVAALLTHQMEQLFKLEEELRQDKKDMVTVRADVQQLENSLKRQELKSQGHPAKRVVSNYTIIQLYRKLRIYCLIEILGAVQILCEQIFPLKTTTPSSPTEHPQ